MAKKCTFTFNDPDTDVALQGLVFRYMRLVWERGGGGGGRTGAGEVHIKMFLQELNQSEI